MSNYCCDVYDYKIDIFRNFIKQNLMYEKEKDYKKFYKHMIFKKFNW